MLEVIRDRGPVKGWHFETSTFLSISDPVSDTNVLVVTNIVHWLSLVIQHGDRTSLKAIMRSHYTFVFSSSWFIYVKSSIVDLRSCSFVAMLDCWYQFIWVSHDGFKEVGHQWWWRVGEEPKTINKTLVHAAVWSQLTQVSLYAAHCQQW